MQVVFSKYTDLLPKEVLNEDTPELQKPDEEAVKEVNHVRMCIYGKTCPQIELFVGLSVLLLESHLPKRAFIFYFFVLLLVTFDNRLVVVVVFVCLP